jgi:hypothetical protein
MSTFPTPKPNVPIIGTITHPSKLVPTGSVLLTGLPLIAHRNWIISSIPTVHDSTGVDFHGVNITTCLVTGLTANTKYKFRVTIRYFDSGGTDTHTWISSEYTDDVIIYNYPRVDSSSTGYRLFERTGIGNAFEFEEELAILEADILAEQNLLF